MLRPNDVIPNLISLRAFAQLSGRAGGPSVGTQYLRDVGCRRAEITGIAGGGAVYGWGSTGWVDGLDLKAVAVGGVAEPIRLLEAVALDDVPAPALPDVPDLGDDIVGVAAQQAARESDRSGGGQLRASRTSTTGLTYWDSADGYLLKAQRTARSSSRAVDSTRGGCGPRWRDDPRLRRLR